MLMSKKGVLLASAVLVGASGVLAQSPQAKKYPADTAVEWFDTLYDRIRDDGVPPPRAARIYGIASITAYLAVEPGMKKNVSLQGQLNGLAAGAIPKPQGKKPFHWPTVMNTAVHDVLVDVFASSATSVTEFDTLEAALNTGFQADIPTKTFNRSVAQGEAVATAVLAWLATDTGFSDQSTCPDYIPGSDPEDWQPTPPGTPTTVEPVLPCWGDVRTFVLSTPTEVPIADHPIFGTSPTASLFYAQALETLASKPVTGSDEEAIAFFWADNPTATGTPPGHWIDVVRQIAVAQDLNLAEAVTAYARVGIGVHDGFVACWEYKYTFNLLRPHTYINSHIDSMWTPLLDTPQFPEYPSGHSTQSGSAAIMLEDAFGFIFPYTDTLHTDQNATGFADRSFTSFDEAAREAALSRLYGGIHYRAGNENGFDCGQAIGMLIRDSVEFLKNEDG